MPKTFTAPFAQTPKVSTCVATTAFALTGANSLVDDTPQNTALLLTAGADGALVTLVRAMPRATCTAAQGALFIRKSGDPAGKRTLLDSVTIAAQTVSTTAAITATTFPIASEANPLRLEAGDELYFGLGTTQANGILGQAAYVNF